MVRVRIKGRGAGKVRGRVRGRVGVRGPILPRSIDIPYDMIKTRSYTTGKVLDTPCIKICTRK
jgi:hypothetical protein